MPYAITYAERQPSEGLRRWELFNTATNRTLGTYDASDFPRAVDDAAELRRQGMGVDIRKAYTARTAGAF